MDRRASLLLVVAVFTLAAAPSAAAPPGSAPLQVVVDSKQAEPMDEAALRKLPVETAALQGHDGAIGIYRGASLHELLKQAGAAEGSQLKGAKMPAYVLAQGADGYQVLFSLTELDPAFRESFALVAYEKNGKPLEASEGPIRLVIPGDRKMARSVRNLVRLQVVTVAAHAPAQ